MRIVLCLLLVAACSIPAKLATGDAQLGGGGDDDGGANGANDAMVDADPAAPTITLTAEPPALGNVASVTFAYDVMPSTATVECRIDANTYQSCPPPSTVFTAIADGAHTFDVRATEDGHTANAPTYSFTIDTVPPTLAITSPPPNPTNMTSGTIGFSAGDAVTVTCALDGAAPQSCTSPAAYSGLANGMHSFALSGTDAAGNAASTTVTWTIQTNPPVLVITGYPPAATNSRTATFTFTTGGASSVTCQLDGGSMAACSSPWTYNNLPDGSHSFVLHGTDPAGNSASATYTWTVDTVPPVVSITSGPTNPTATRSTTFAFTTNEGTTTCGLDGAFSACSSPDTFTPADGTHTFAVRATDAAGNSTTTGNYVWLLDSTKPVISGLKYTCSASTGELDVTYTVVEANLSSVTCVYAGNPVTCSAGGYSGNMNGASSTFSVTATDVAGNQGAGSVVVKELACE